MESHSRTQRSFVDETFRCNSTDVECLVEYLKLRRSNVLSRLDVERRISLFIPQGDPPFIRITGAESRNAFFTLGELARWRFIRNFPSYPLKAHQEEGVAWLRKRPNAILADDMGLGKTLQAIAAFEQKHRAGEVENALIVCPKSLIGVWEAEISLWAPRLCAVALHTKVTKKTWAVLPAQCQVAITNYEAIRSNGPGPGAFDVVILDEVHKLKNSKSLNYSACYALQPKLAASTGSACTSGFEEPSHVLTSMGLTRAEAEGSIRFSIGKATTKQDLLEAVALINQSLDDLSSSQA